MYKITGMFADYIALSNIIRNKMKNNEYTRWKHYKNIY
jgi:hypothetical protein